MDVIPDIVLRVQGGVTAAGALTQIKLAATRFPGEMRLAIEVCHGEERITTITLGPEWGYDGSPACLAALGEFGTLR